MRHPGASAGHFSLQGRKRAKKWKFPFFFSIYRKNWLYNIIGSCCYFFIILRHLPKPHQKREGPRLETRETEITFPKWMGFLALFGPLWFKGERGAGAKYGTRRSEMVQGTRRYLSSLRWFPLSKVIQKKNFSQNEWKKQQIKNS